MNENFPEYTFNGIYAEKDRLRWAGTNAFVVTASRDWVEQTPWQVLGHCSGAIIEYWLVVKPLPHD